MPRKAPRVQFEPPNTLWFADTEGVAAILSTNRHEPDAHMRKAIHWHRYELVYELTPTRKPKKPPKRPSKRKTK